MEECNTLYLAAHSLKDLSTPFLASVCLQSAVCFVLFSLVSHKYITYIQTKLEYF